MMEVSVEMNIAARGLHVYGKMVLQSPCKEEKLVAARGKQGRIRNRSIYCCMDVQKEN